MDKLDWHKSYMNIGALQTVSINLPRIAYLANGNDDKFFEILDERLLQCIEIFMLKKQLLENRYTSGKIEILNNMVSFPGETEKQLLFDFEKQSVVIGFVGGNEMCLAHTGHEIHEGNGALTFMTKVLKYMAQRCDEYSVEKQYNIALWEQPAESTCGRFASLDAEQFKDKCICQGKDSKSYYYTNSSHIRYGADVSLSKIIQIQSQFHPIVQGGVITHIWLGEAVSDPDALMKMTERIMGTPTLYFAYTFDFSQCTDCNLFVKGVLKTCPNCKSDKIEIYSRITGYYARVSRFGDSKFQEWKDRKRHNSL
jgi:ribonucleoside-triphosphate reductase